MDPITTVVLGLEVVLDFGVLDFGAAQDMEWNEVVGCVFGVALLLHLR